MTKPGPKKRPAHLQVRHGETRPSRVNYREPQAPGGTAGIVPPDYLDEDARAVWERLAPTMIPRMMLTVWDPDAFGVYCTAVAHHARAARKVNEMGVIVAGDKGVQVKNPALQVVRDQAAIIATYASRFGLTPGDRASIVLPDEALGAQSAAGILD
jgi:P27 family predicted phage terminase small subunit